MVSSAVRPLAVPRGGRFRYDSEPGTDSAAGGGSDSTTNLHDALSHRQHKSSTMRCQKKLHDALSVRTYARRGVDLPHVALPAIRVLRPAPLAADFRHFSPIPSTFLRGKGVTAGGLASVKANEVFAVGPWPQIMGVCDLHSLFRL